MPETKSENLDDKEDKKSLLSIDINNNDCEDENEEIKEEELLLAFRFTTSDYVISTPDDDDEDRRNKTEDIIERQTLTNKNLETVTLTNENQSQLSLPNHSCVLDEERSSKVPNTNKRCQKPKDTHLSHQNQLNSNKSHKSSLEENTSFSDNSDHEQKETKSNASGNEKELFGDDDPFDQTNQYDSEDDQPIRRVVKTRRNKPKNNDSNSPRELVKRSRTPNSILKGSQKHRPKPKSAITVLECTNGDTETLDNLLQTSPSKILETPRKKKYKQPESALMPQSPRTLAGMLASPRSIPYALTSLSRSNSDNCLFGKTKNKLSAKDILFNKKLKYLKSLVETAIKSRKTFTVLGHFPNIREAFRARGWLEKYHDIREEYPRPSNDSKDEHMVSRMLRDAQVNFLWTMRGDTLDWKRISKNTLVSRFPRAYFTTKVGLCSHLQHMHWFSEAVHFPRCHNISSPDDLTELCTDFRLTACLSLLRYVVYGIDSTKLNFFHEDGKVPLCAVEFASRRCAEFLSCQMHEDIDLPSQVKIWDHQWDQFLTWYYQIVHNGESFVKANKGQIHAIYQCSKHTVEHAKKFWPQMHLDGFRNLWIVKPGAKSRGRGIQVMHKLEDIVQKITATNTNDPRFVVQKYIERPLLIYNTKFDIRQWFLVTSAYPLTVWMYKESYLRFCSQNYSLVNMHESVHLSNNAIQCKYQNGTRHRHLPDENMWDCYSFQAYLRTMGVADVWHKVIYPGMKDGIVGSLLASQDSFDHRRNCFELYGADFMLAQNFVPWLIEINSGPCMAASTSVTARLCAQVLEDVIKVVVDRREDKNADTGMFELVYKQTISPSQPYMGQNLTLRGFKMLPDLSPKLARKSAKYWSKSAKRERERAKLVKQESQTFSFNDCTSEVYEMISKLQVQLMMGRRSSEIEQDDEVMNGKEEPNKQTVSVSVQDTSQPTPSPSPICQDSIELQPEKPDQYTTSLDKVINIINNNYRAAFSGKDKNENVNGNKEQTKNIKTRVEENRNEKDVKGANTEINKAHKQTKNLTISETSNGSVEGNATEIVENKIEINKDETSCDNADDTMDDDDESFKIELDENLDVFTDIPEINEDLEKGFEYFQSETSKNTTKKSKDKSKKCKKRKKMDENLELLNEWKTKVSETRKNCKDIVNNLKLKTNLMKSKNNKYEIDWNNEMITNGSQSVKKLNLPSETKKENVKTLPVVREVVKMQKLVHSAKPVTVPYCKSPPLINSPIHFRKSPTHVTRSATFTKSPSPKCVSPNQNCSNHSPLGNKSPLSSPHSSPRNSSGSIFPHIKPNIKSPENLFAVGMSLKCFNSNKDQMITA
uniref:Tubulin glycylase 3A n=1 Tax=Cacopsylla melanoneura TaxID=428564 RepID=A0A8D8PXP4_9HEMI